MALKDNFYSEIFAEEQKWINMLESNLLNVIYCKHSLQPFYIQKKLELEEENSVDKNPLIEQIIVVFGNIIDQIDVLNELYITNKSNDVDVLFPLFLINKMNNKSQKQNVNQSSTIEQLNNLKIRRQVLESMLSNRETKQIDDDYLDDDIDYGFKQK